MKIEKEITEEGEEVEIYVPETEEDLKKLADMDAAGLIDPD